MGSPTLRHTVLRKPSLSVHQIQRGFLAHSTLWNKNYKHLFTGYIGRSYFAVHGIKKAKHLHSSDSAGVPSAWHLVEWKLVMSNVFWYVALGWALCSNHHIAQGSTVERNGVALWVAFIAWLSYCHMMSDHLSLLETTGVKRIPQGGIGWTSF